MTPRGFRNGGGKWHGGGDPGVFGEPDRNKGTVPVDVGHGQKVEAKVGSDFVNTVEQIARDSNYGGYYKVYLAKDAESGMTEIVNPGDAPSKIESGMRIAIAPYDKVG